MESPLLKHVPGHVLREATNICGQLFEKTCCSKLIYKLDFTDQECLKLFMIKILGYGIIFTGSIVKVPQLLKVFKAKSGVGLSAFGIALELLAITFNGCYSLRNNFPLSAWGECIALGLETALILYLILWYDGLRARAVSFLFIFGCFLYCLTHPTLVPSDIMWYLQSSVVYLSVSGKLMQVLKNYKAQHTGQISAISAWALFAGSFARILTTIQETGDFVTTVAFVCSSCANAIIATQVLWYWKSTQQFMERSKKKKTN